MKDFGANKERKRFSFPLRGEGKGGGEKRYKENH